MATTRNIQMQYFNGTDYDVLHPETNIDNVLNANSILDETIKFVEIGNYIGSTGSVITFPEGKLGDLILIAKGQYEYDFTNLGANSFGNMIRLHLNGAYLPLLWYDTNVRGKQGSFDFFIIRRYKLLNYFLFNSKRYLFQDVYATAFNSNTYTVSDNYFYLVSGISLIMSIETLNSSYDRVNNADFHLYIETK